MNGDSSRELAVHAPGVRRDAVVADQLSKRYRRTSHGIVPVPRLLGSLRPQGAPVGAVDETAEDELDDEEEIEQHDDGEPGPRELWALRDVSFRVVEGQGLALIGPNGSGKTTLLKILARITPPTSGRAILRGRVAPLLSLASSLLQAGRTGRENVLLLAKFLDVPVELARRRVDDVIAFAELEDVADQQVGGYSAGQKQRLAFASVLELDPEILLADELLSVGDAAFKHRCLERVGEAQRAGLTIVFASHDLDRARSLCDRALWLDRGRIVAEGPADEVIERYERHVAETRTVDEAASSEEETGEILLPRSPGARPRFSLPIRRPSEQTASPRSFNANVSIVGVSARRTSGDEHSFFRAGEDVLLRITLEAAAATVEVACSVVLLRDGQPAVRLVQPEAFRVSEPGFYAVEAIAPAAVLSGGQYAAKVGTWVVTKKGEESVLVRRRGLAFEIGRREGDEDDQSSPLVELADLAWSVEKVTA